MGSRSDSETVREAVDILKRFEIGHEIRVLSAHRSPWDVAAYVERLEERGVAVVIAAAGGAAALAGTAAAHTVLPVIGIPVETRALKGLDSLLSTVQMPRGVPVGCMAIGKSGAQNAAVFAAQILALENKQLRKKLRQFKQDAARAIRKMKAPRK